MSAASGQCQMHPGTACSFEHKDASASQMYFAACMPAHNKIFEPETHRMGFAWSNSCSILLLHDEIFKCYQSTSKVHAELLQTLLVCCTPPEVQCCKITDWRSERLSTSCTRLLIACQCISPHMRHISGLPRLANAHGFCTHHQSHAKYIMYTLCKSCHLTSFLPHFSHQEVLPFSCEVCLTHTTSAEVNFGGFCHTLSESCLCQALSSEQLISNYHVKAGGAGQEQHYPM